MLVVKVELHPYGDPTKVQTLASMIIANTGTSEDISIGNYNVYKLDKDGKRSKKGLIKNHPRLAVSVWRLVAKAIKLMERPE